MKISVLTTLSFLLLLFSTKLLLGRSASNEPVLDIYNNTVSSDLTYIIKGPATNETLSLHDGTPAPCPFDVVQEPYIENGTLTSFLPIDGSTTVTESTDLNVKYLYQIVYCGDTEYPIWKVSDKSILPTEWLIVVQEFDDTDPKTWFRLQRVGSYEGQATYKFVFCHAFESESEICYNLRIFWVSGAYHLVLDKKREPASQFVLVPVYSGRIKLVTSN